MVENRIRPSIYSLALANKAKVAIGLNPEISSSERVMNSALFAKREGYADPILVSVCDSRPPEIAEEVPLLISECPERFMVNMLKEGVVDAAVRGNLSANTMLSGLRSAFNCNNLYRITLMEIQGRPVMLAPVGIDEGDTIEDLLTFAAKGKEIAELLGMDYRVGVISGGRLEDVGRSPKVDKILSFSISLTQRIREMGLEVENFGIEIERAIKSGASILLAPDGIIGNIIFRSLVLVANIDSFGAYASGLPKVYVDTSRAKVSYFLPIVLASALSCKSKI
ncbi:MAG: methyltransferase [Candidatus Verstraetearchaeota archaeon]|nr:methyltransferase [Candidatus Verstraetearchaeota archaeon]